MTSSSRRGVALATGSIAGLALASLVLPELANTLSPTAVGIGLLSLVLGLATLAAQRLNECYRRRSGIERALRGHPPVLMRDADLATLGVYPPFGSDGREEPYRARPNDEDGQLRRALRRSTCVVVQGPDRCGKSRAAAEAARLELADLPVIVPFDSAGLAFLLENDLDTALRSKHRRICLWLDGLERYVETLDTRALRPSRHGVAKRTARRIAGRQDREFVLVATIRTSELERLRSESGQATEAIRALEGMAEVVELRARPRISTPLAPPRTVASRRGPGEPPTGLEETGGARIGWPPVDGLFGVQIRNGGESIQRQWAWADGLTIGLVAGVFVVTGLMVLGFFDGQRRLLAKPPSISDQITSLTHDLENEVGHGQVVFNDRVRMHPTDEPSWIIGLHRVATSRRPSDTRSDEVLVYDVHSGWLDRELSFRPAWHGARAAALWQVPATGTEPAGYRKGGEFVAGYEFMDHGSPAVVPFAVYWDDSRNNYKLKGLTKYLQPEYSSHRLDPQTRRFRRREYGGGWLRLPNAAGRLGGNWGLQGYPIGAFAVTEQPSGRLLTGYYFKPYDHRATNRVELQVTQLRGAGTATACFKGKPACPGPVQPVVLSVPPDKSDNNGLLEAWQKVKRHWSGRIGLSQG